MAARHRRKVARLLTEVLAPVVLICGLLIVVAVSSSGGLARGLFLGLAAAAFAGGLPYAVLLVRVHRGLASDRHLLLREQRPFMMALGLASVTLGLIVMWLLHAPQQLFALVAAMVAGVAVSLVISLVWKISIHAACAAGTVAVLVVVFGAWMLVSSLLVIAVAWARVTLKDHDVPQVVGGSLVGALVAGCVMVWLG